MSAIAENVALIRRRIAQAASEAGRDPSDVLLVAATKTWGPDEVRQAIAAGVDACGENRVQELTEKNSAGAYAGAPLHFIGHLQRNKVNKVVGVADLIESVDSVELLRLIDARAAALGVTQDVLLEINIAGELSKTGAPPEELPAMLDMAAACGRVRVRGLMTVPPIAAEKGASRPYFAAVKQLFVDIDTKKYNNVSMDFLSMGMSGDFEDAVAEGANLVRIGSAIFGARSYGHKEE